MAAADSVIHLLTCSVEFSTLEITDNNRNYRLNILSLASD